VRDLTRMPICTGSIRKKTAAGMQEKKMSSNRTVKSKVRQLGFTLGPKVKSLPGGQLDDVIVSRVASSSLNKMD
jgi:hypothetical protein